MGFAGLCWALLLDAVGLCWDLSGFDCFCEVLLVSVEFCWILGDSVELC